MKKETIFLLGLFIFLLFNLMNLISERWRLGSWANFQWQKRVELSRAKETHKHADFALFIDGEKIDFSGDEYMSYAGHRLDKHTHLHDNNGSVIHVHTEGVTLEYFLQTLGIELTKNCLVYNYQDWYCPSEEDSLRIMVNGEEVESNGQYVIQDEDRILVSYGQVSEAELREQFAQVTDEACIYSETCPERGEAPPEGCTGGLGGECSI